MLEWYVVKREWSLRKGACLFNNVLEPLPPLLMYTKGNPSSGVASFWDDKPCSILKKVATCASSLATSVSYLAADFGGIHWDANPGNGGSAAKLLSFLFVLLIFFSKY